LLNTLRLQLRFLVPLVVALLVAAALAVPLMDQLTLRWFSRDLNLRGAALSAALSDSIERALDDPAHQTSALQSVFDRTARDERLVAIALCGTDGQIVRASAPFPADLTCGRARALADSGQPTLLLASGRVHVAWHDVVTERGRPGGSVLLHDLRFIELRSRDTQYYLIALIAGLGFVIALITVVVAQISWRGWVQGARAVMRGEGLVRPWSIPTPEVVPVATELRSRLRDLEDDYRRAIRADLDWTPDRLRALLRSQLHGDDVIVVSNREPYLHEHEAGGIVVRQPASGLVTALEPVMRACSGTWIAHRSGSADRDTVDDRDGVPVPPGDPRYRLRRVWLSEAEEQGYYDGLANEGLWPLCHVAHVRPVFRESDWEAYRAVNERFADAVAAEARTEDPVVLIQDYHFALLPAMVRRRLPKATILTFWHIPWPNPESFGICPWRRDILQGLLGSSILGFHTRYHCKNFIETVDRYLEARIEHEHSTISVGGLETLVESYPISIAWPSEAEARAWPAVPACRERIDARLGLAPGQRLAVGGTASTTPRASSNDSTRSSACSRSIRSGSACSPSRRSPPRPAARSRSTARSRRGLPPWLSTSTSASGARATSRCTCWPSTTTTRRSWSSTARPMCAWSPACTTA
jgi:trehalose 6-phosphate synthase